MGWASAWPRPFPPSPQLAKVTIVDHHAATFAKDFLHSLADMDPFSSFTSGFYRLTLLSFLQTHANPANCRHRPPGFTASGLPATRRVHSFHDAGRL